MHGFNISVFQLAEAWLRHDEDGETLASLFSMSVHVHIIDEPLLGCFCWMGSGKEPRSAIVQVVGKLTQQRMMKSQAYATEDDEEPRVLVCAQEAQITAFSQFLAWTRRRCL